MDCLWVKEGLMSQTETLQPEAGDDRIRETEIAKLQEMYDVPAAPEPGPGDIIIQRAGKFGHLLFTRADITILN